MNYLTREERETFEETLGHYTLTDAQTVEAFRLLGERSRFAPFFVYHAYHCGHVVAAAIQRGAAVAIRCGRVAIEESTS